MSGPLYEWDEAKRLGNIVKHAADFAEAKRMFAGRRWIRRSSYPGEERWLATTCYRAAVDHACLYMARIVIVDARRPA